VPNLLSPKCISPLSSKISICIPVKNPGRFFEPLLESISRQNVPAGWSLEVVFLNSGEKLPPPKNGELSRKEVMVNPETFNHGATRNLGVKECTGEIIVFTVQDACFLGQDLINEVVLSFQKHPEIVAVSGYQSVPWKKENHPAKWFRPQNAGTLKLKRKPANWAQLGYMEKRSFCSLDNVICSYKRKELELFPFEATMYGEDITWGKSAIQRGAALGFHGGIRVWHYHQETLAYIRNRLKCTHYIESKLFGTSYLKMRLPELKNYYLIFFKSRKLNVLQRILWALKEFRNYLWIQTLILTNDHKVSPTIIKIGNQKG